MVFIQSCISSQTFIFLILPTNKIKKWFLRVLAYEKWLAYEMTGLWNFFPRYKIKLCMIIITKKLFKNYLKNKKAIFKNNKYRKIYENIFHLNWMFLSRNAFKLLEGPISHHLLHYSSNNSSISSFCIHIKQCEFCTYQTIWILLFFQLYFTLFLLEYLVLKSFSHK